MPGNANEGGRVPDGRDRQAVHYAACIGGRTQCTVIFEFGSWLPIRWKVDASHTAPDETRVGMRWLKKLNTPRAPPDSHLCVPTIAPICTRSKAVLGSPGIPNVTVAEKHLHR